MKIQGWKRMVVTELSRVVKTNDGNEQKCVRIRGGGKNQLTNA